MIVKVDHHNHLVTHSTHTSPANWDRIQNFIEYANGYLERGRQDFGNESDAVRYAGYEFEGCTVPFSYIDYESYFNHDVTMIPFAEQQAKSLSVYLKGRLHSIVPAS